MNQDTATDVNIKYIREDIQRIEKLLESHIGSHLLKLEKIDERLYVLEKWKIAFVARFAAYCSVALFFGSIASQLLIWAITK